MVDSQEPLTLRSTGPRSGPDPWSMRQRVSTVGYRSTDTIGSSAYREERTGVNGSDVLPTFPLLS